MRAASAPARLLLAVWGVVAAVAVVAALLPAAPAAAQEGEVTPARIEGTNRYDTAANVSGVTFEAADVVHVATGENFPDALAGSYAAGAVGGPLLLVTRDAVPERTWQELDRLGAEWVVLIGGPTVISEQVEAEFAGAGYQTDRIHGDDRYATAAAVANHYGPQVPVGRLDGQRTALLASGGNFPDALALGPLAARVHLPLLLTPPARTDDVVDATLANLGIERIVIAGGPGAVDPGVAAHYEARGYTVERWAGPNRTATAAAVADNAVRRLGFALSRVILARGNNFPDALTASIHAGELGAPLLLSRSESILGEPTRDWLRGACPDVSVVRAVGGTGAVSPSVLSEAVSAAENCSLTVVSTFTTPLVPGQDRNINIHRAADYVDGRVIASGAGFSLNQAIGPRTRERGFVEDGFISGGETTTAIGGGVSQVATTFVNAAWFAGIRLVEFRQHTIYFERYPMCHEGTIVWDQLDVVVQNDSPYNITIDTSYTDSSVTFTFLSRPWAQVDSWVSDPYNVEGPGGAFSVNCGRTITYPDGTQRAEDYSWRYNEGYPG